jgi:hypothetical protein
MAQARHRAIRRTANSSRFMCLMWRSSRCQPIPAVAWSPPSRKSICWVKPRLLHVTDDQIRNPPLPVLGIWGFADRVVVQPSDQHRYQCATDHRKEQKAPSRVTQKKDYPANCHRDVPTQHRIADPPVGWLPIAIAPRETASAILTARNRTFRRPCRMERLERIR